MYTNDDVLQFVKEEDVKFIRLSFFTDDGTQKNISIMAEELPNAFNKGVVFSAIKLFDFKNTALDHQNNTLVLHPESATLAILPWRPANGKVVRMVCSITYPNGMPFEHDYRAILKNTMEYTKKDTFLYNCRSKFTLYKRDANGVATNNTFDAGTLMDVAPLDKGENIRREICLTLRDMGIEPTASFHAEESGSNEIDFTAGDAVSACDDLQLLKWIVATKAASYGLWAYNDANILSIYESGVESIRLSFKEKYLSTNGYQSTVIAQPPMESYNPYFTLKNAMMELLKAKQCKA